MTCQVAVGVFESVVVGAAEELNPLVDDVDLDPNHCSHWIWQTDKSTNARMSM